MCRGATQGGKKIGRLTLLLKIEQLVSCPCDAKITLQALFQSTYKKSNHTSLMQSVDSELTCSGRKGSEKRSGRLSILKSRNSGNSNRVSKTDSLLNRGVQISLLTTKIDVSSESEEPLPKSFQRRKKQKTAPLTSIRLSS